MSDATPNSTPESSPANAANAAGNTPEASSSAPAPAAAAHAGHDDGHGHGHHGPSYVEHHFNDHAQQVETGKLGMWVFLSTEILLFSGLFCAYAVLRHLHPEMFHFGHFFLDKNLGALNTVVLLASSLTMAWAVRAAMLGKRNVLVFNLAATFLFGCVFFGVKAIEYSHKIHAGLLWGSSFNPNEEALPGGHGAEADGHESAPVADAHGDHGDHAPADNSAAGHDHADHSAAGHDAHAVSTSLRVSDVRVERGEVRFRVTANGPADHSMELHLAALIDGNRVPLDISGTDATLKTDGKTATVADFARSADALGVGYESTHSIVIEASAGDLHESSTMISVFRRRAPADAPASIVAHAAEAPAGTRRIAPEESAGHHFDFSHEPPNLHLFFGLYFIMTGLHGIHVAIGMIVILWLLVRGARGHFTSGYYEPVDIGGLYWHLVDLIWIFLFPLLYLID